MKILIIGSKGFIGSHCLQYFSKNNKVFGCDVIDSIEKEYWKVQGAEDFFKIFLGEKFDLCINASGSADVSFSIKFPQKDFEMNVSNVENVLNAIRSHNSKCKFINFSSAAVYGNPKSLPISESAETSPLSPYGKHKLQAERLLKKYYDEYGLPTCSLRVFSAYGHGLKKQLFWDIYQKSKKSETVQLFGTGKESRDFIFIDDLMSAIQCVVTNSEFKGEFINVASGIETTIEIAAKIFLNHLKKKYQLSFSNEERIGDPQNWRADITHLSRMGFKHFHNFEEGISKLARWIKEEK